LLQSKKSFFERLTGTVKIDDENELMAHDNVPNPSILDEDPTDGQLAVDVYRTAEEIVIKTMIAGVRPDDLDINITRSMVTIRGKREEAREVRDNDYFFRELYWGTFSRTISLPEEIEVEDAEAIEKHGLLIIRLPKIDKARNNKLKVKSS
jgi:HSP20 family protein